MDNINRVHEYYQTIRDRLKNYIKSDYLSNSETLLLYLDDILGEQCSKNTNIACEPYFETSSSYKKIPDGIKNSQQIYCDVKDFLLKLVKENLGIFPDPFEHQVKALEYFLSGKDLFVSTGTGSGKTECFLLSNWGQTYTFDIILCFQKKLSLFIVWKNSGLRQKTKAGLV